MVPSLLPSFSSTISSGVITCILGSFAGMSFGHACVREDRLGNTLVINLIIKLIPDSTRWSLSSADGKMSSSFSSRRFVFYSRYYMTGKRANIRHTTRAVEASGRVSSKSMMSRVVMSHR